MYLVVFHDMLLVECGLMPNDTTLAIVFSATARLGRFDEGKLIHEYIEKNGFTLDGKLGIALIDMYAKCGSIKSSMSVFESLEKRSVDHWNAMIGGLAIHGLGKLALQLFMMMGKLSLEPDDITLIRILTACGHAGMVIEGFASFELMRRVYRIEPKMQHYGCMVNIFARTGHLEEARKLIDSLPIKPNDVIWRALLSACKTHNNFEMGILVAKHLIKSYLCSMSSCVLLSNLYAYFGMWNDVSRVRSIMKESGMRKVSGCSWIELEGVVHEFVVGDKSHPQVGEIYSVLDDLCIHCTS